MQRTCPGCRQPMRQRNVGGVVVDVCTTCKGVFLDPGEDGATGIDTAELFGRSATPLGPSERLCPTGHEAMLRFRIDIGGSHSIEIERSRCCGGVFLDAGEHSLLVKASRDTAATPSGPPAGFTPSAMPAGFAPSATPGGGPSAAPPARASAPGVRTCPRCNQAMQQAALDGGGIIDHCSGCEGVFLDAGEAELQGADTSALFGDGPEAAVSKGPSALSCPACRQPMRTFEVETLAGTLQVERGDCCGGFFLDGGERGQFLAAARVAFTARADREHAEGKPLTPSRARASGTSAADASATAFMKSKADGAVAELAAQRAAQRARAMGFGRRRRRGIVGILIDMSVDYDDEW